MRLILQTGKAVSLYEKSSAWDFANPPMPSELLESELKRLMEEHQGVGISANQAGLTHRVFMINLGENAKAYYNPEVLNWDDEIVLGEEGCLSFPGLRLRVKRPETIRVRYQDNQGASHEEVLTGVMSLCFQHELDHLDGICFISRVSKLSLAMAKKRQSKNQRSK